MKRNINLPGISRFWIIVLTLLSLIPASSQAQSSSMEILTDSFMGITVKYEGERWVPTLLAENGPATPSGVSQRAIGFINLNKQELIAVESFSNHDQLSLQQWIDRFDYKRTTAISRQSTTTIADELATVVYELLPSSHGSPSNIRAIVRHTDKIYVFDYSSLSPSDNLYASFLKNVQFIKTEQYEPSALSLDIRKSFEDRNAKLAPSVASCCGVNDPEWNPFPCNDANGNGNCTWWVRYRRTGDNIANLYLCTGDASTWDECAVQHYPQLTGGNPRPNDAVVWTSPGSNHVAFLESLSGSTLDMSQMNWGGPCPQSYIHESAANKFFIHLSPDSTPPSIAFTASPQTNRWYNSNQRIDWSIADDNSGVKGMSQAWDATAPGPPPQFPGATGGWLDFTTTTEGQHTVKVRAWDNAGNERAAELGWFGYDISKPSGSLLAPPDGSATSTPTWTLRASATDSLSGVKQVVFYARYDGIWRLLCTDTAAPYECAWSLPAGVADQDVTFSIHVLDVAGNSQPDAGGYRVVTVDRRAPTGSVALNNGWGSADGLAMPLSLAADGTGSQVREVRTSADGVTWGAWQTMETKVWAILSGQHGGNASAYVQYKDAAGNISAVVSASIVLNFYPDRPHSANYAILKNVQVVAGGTYQSAGYRLNGSVGQPLASANTSSAHYRATWGYWSALQRIRATLKTFMPFLIK
jgi:hypothetical protein